VESILVWSFWTAIALLFHNFVFFGLTVRLLAWLKRDTADSSPVEPFDPTLLPTMTVFIPAHNEESIIAEKLETVLAQEYPADKLDVVVASDVSTDRTDEIVRSFSRRGVRLVSFTERHGKLGALDELVPQLRGDVVVITDANVMLEPEALHKLGTAYLDPRVGAACGMQTVELPSGYLPLSEEITYRDAESRLKISLSKLGCIVAAFGGLYSLRRECFRPIGSKPMEDDIILPMEVLAQRQKAVFVPEAVGREEIGGTIREEYHRRIRMTAYNFNTAGRALSLAFRAGVLPLYVFSSYKLLRWIAPLLWVTLLISSTLLHEFGRHYSVVAETMWLGVLAAALGGIGALFGKRWGLFFKAYYFALMNFATLPGLLRWAKGVQRFWAPRTA
jgi:cellulose synthase/poly-beta-1,6-N-acetylglucosamine synthase-like glycosyltransferase